MRYTCILVLILCIASAVSAGWIDSCDTRTTKNCPTLMMGVSCESASLCAIVGGFSNTPESVYYSKDQFKTFTLANMNADSFMLLDIAIDRNGAGATAGLGLLNNTGILYSKDVLTWNPVADKNFLQGQDINAFGNGEFGFVGSTNAFANQQGVLVSNDAGQDWAVGNWPDSLNNFTQARYGSFPSDQVLYVSGGSWPSNNLFQKRHSPNCLALSHKLCVNVGDKYANAVAAFNAKNVKDTSGYTAVLTKSTDGGKTWQVQFKDTGKFYFNDINCIDTTHCFAVGEGFTDGTQPGARIYGTTDGTTWTQVFFDNSPNASMGRVHMVSRTEAWAAGGNEKNGIAYGTFYHTVDGGKSWQLSSDIEFVGDVMSMFFVDSKLGFAVGITEFQTATLLTYTA